MKKYLALMLCLLFLVGCQGKKEMYQVQYYDAFDTVTTLMVPAKSQEEAKEVTDKIHGELLRYHKLFDNYHSYPGMNNVKTINEAAGKAPVKVDKELFDLVKTSLDRYHKQSKEVNIAMGSVLSIWSDYREGHEVGADFQGKDPAHEGKEAEIPSMESLKEAAAHTNIEDVVLNEEDQSIYLKDPQMSLDLGAVAKGYATEKLAGFMQDRLKLESALISAGGNVRVIGKPLMPGKDGFIIGLQNPEAADQKKEDVSNVLDRFSVKDSSVVTSGDYQRYYIVDGKRYHHLIDPKTLMPADYFRSVTIVTKDSGLADFLSTAVFLMPYEEGRKLIDSMDGVEAYWVFPDMSVHYTKGIDKIRRGAD